MSAFIWYQTGIDTCTTSFGKILKFLQNLHVKQQIAGFAVSTVCTSGAASGTAPPQVHILQDAVSPLCITYTVHCALKSCCAQLQCYLERTGGIMSWVRVNRPIDWFDNIYTLMPLYRHVACSTLYQLKGYATINELYTEKLRHGGHFE